MKKKKTLPEALNLPEDYILRNRYTQFLLDEGKYYYMGKRMLICWYIGPETGRLIGMFWREGEEVPCFLAYNIRENGILSYNNKGVLDAWGDLFDNIRLSPKSYYTPSMAYVFSGCINSAPRDNGKIIPFPALDHSGVA